MTLSLRTAPKKAVDCVLTALQLRVADGKSALLGGALDIAKPIPRYRGDPESLRTTARITPKGWAILLVGEDRNVLAGSLTIGNRYEFAGLATGGYADTLLAAATLAAELFENDPEPYRVALIESDRSPWIALLVEGRTSSYLIDLIHGVLVPSDAVEHRLRDT